MSERNEKAKRVLDNSTKIVAGIGIVAILFAVWFSIQFAKSKTKKEFDARQTYFNDIHQNFNKDWANNAFWDSLKLEENVYQSIDKKYTLTYNLRKETFNDQFNVKTKTNTRPDLYKVLNASIEMNDNSDTSYVSQLTTLCMNPLVLHKMTTSVQHPWGITHKSYFNNKSVITLKYDSYLDKQGIGDKVFPKDVLFEDQLPVCLRALNFNDSVKFKVDVLESQLIDGIGTFKIYNANVSMKSVKVNETDAFEVIVKLNDENQNMYYFESAFPNRLLKFKKNNLLFEKL